MLRIPRIALARTSRGRRDSARGHTGSVGTELRPLLRGLAKLATIVLAAGLAGTLAGIGLAKLSGNDGGETSTAPVAAATTAQTPTTAASPPAGAQSQPAQPTTEGSAIADPAPAAGGDSASLRVDVLSARLTLASPKSDRSSVVAQVRVTNPGSRSVVLDPPMLVSDANAFRLDAGGGADAGSLLGTLAAGASATGLLRFTPSSKVTRRLVADPNAQLRIAGRTVTLKLTRQSR